MSETDGRRFQVALHDYGYLSTSGVVFRGFDDEESARDLLNDTVERGGWAALFELLPGGSERAD